uniref:Gnk2-homologous domain-containing protein n=1 Tax=Hordeum vulgare subsp. vulgare TaxID=112509 RepID=A0A8I6X2R6_HORVV
MARSTPPSLLLLLFVLVAASAASEDRPRVTPTLVQCHLAPAQAAANASSAKNPTAFRANVRALLAKLPSAAAPTGFASLRSAGAAGRGLCFGHAGPSECRACLSAAAKTLADACGARGRRAGVWTDGCFASYADANASSPRYDGFRARVISGADAVVASTSYELQSLADLAWRMGPVAATNARMQVAVDWRAAASDYRKNSTVRVLAQCAPDRTAAECAWCVQYSARVAETCAAGWSWCPRHSARAGDTCCWGLDAWRDGVAGAVVGFDCYLRFDVAVATAAATATAPARVPLLHRIGKLMNDYPVLTAVFGIVGAWLAVAAFYVLIEGICCCMGRRIRPINNAPVAPVPGPAIVQAGGELNPPQPQARAMV